VLGALANALPHEAFIYLGDTARLPYGTKSVESVSRYAAQAAEHLVGRGIKALIIACNTACAAALETLRTQLKPLPVIGVIEPGARAACSSACGRIAVIGTEATVRGAAYEGAIRRLRPDAQVFSRACQLLVALAEEGWSDGEVALAVARRYLEPLFAACRADTLVLGCTHFPMLRSVITAVVGESVAIVDSAATTAEATEQELRAHNLLREGSSEASGGAKMRFLATDNRERFAAVGSRFIGRALESADVELVDL
jgi:glutamate racemase